MTTMDLLKRMEAYMEWANRVIWKLVDALTDEEFSQSFGEHGSSIHSRYIRLAEDSRERYHDWIGKNRD